MSSVKNIKNFLTLRNKGIKYFILNLVSIFIFGILYWLSDIFFVSNSGTSKKYDFDKYLHFSLITQTTVGYGKISAEFHNNKIANSNNDNNLFEILNFLQLLSIVYILAITFQD
jgi:hypothetical protein